MRSRHYLQAAKIAGKLNRENSSQAGFAVPLALGMGLVMIIVAASTIGRSQSDRNTTSFQKETNRALGVSEAGIIRVQLFLDRSKLLATKNLDQWVDTLNSLPAEQINCSSINLTAVKQQAEIFKNHSWINLDTLDPNKGRYRIIDYQYQAGIGKLTLSGEVAAYNTTNNSSNSTLTVEIPIGSEDAKIAPPALWAQTFKLSPIQQINGQIRAVACAQPTDKDPDGIAGIDRTNITEIDSQPTGQIVADLFTSIPQARVAPNNFIKLDPITSSIQLPRLKSSDSPDANHEYNYLVDVDPAGYSIKLKDNSNITIKVIDDRKVNLYLKGNIDLAGGKTTNVNKANPNLRIYGSDRTLKLSIKDSASITALIHAPFADAQSIKSSSSSTGITGAVWVKSWDSATSMSKITILQAGNWADFGVDKIEQPSQPNPISSWHRVERKN
jgi:hypothetical protein